MIRCRHCGRFMIRKGKRQEYCDSEECQKAKGFSGEKGYGEGAESKEKTVQINTISRVRERRSSENKTVEIWIPLPLLQGRYG